MFEAVSTLTGVLFEVSPKNDDIVSLCVCLCVGFVFDYIY